MKDSINLDDEKINIVKPQLRKKWKIWLSFIFFGWSYGSFGKLGLQILWYAIPIITAYGLYQYHETRHFTIYTSMAIVGFGIWFVWGFLRVVTLNRSIKQYNRTLANFYGLTDDEKKVLGIE